MVRVTLDANVIVSGLYGSGNPRRILAAAEAGSIRLQISPAILAEVSEVLQREKLTTISSPWATLAIRRL